MDEMIYPIPDKLYNVLKWVGLVVLPALAVLFSTVCAEVAPVVGIDPAIGDVVATILNAFGVFIGVVIGASAAIARR